jgi:hypothetical protein
MGVETPPKYVDRELNSQIGVRGQNSHLELSDGAPPTTCFYGVLHMVSQEYT